MKHTPTLAEIISLKHPATVPYVEIIYIPRVAVLIAVLETLYVR